MKQALNLGRLKPRRALVVWRKLLDQVIDKRLGIGSTQCLERLRSVDIIRCDCHTRQEVQNLADMALRLREIDLVQSASLARRRGQSLLL